jgi:hypothetical protein
MTGDDVRAWLASLDVVEAEACTRCGHREGPFVALPDDISPPSPYCHLCVIRSQAMDEWERLLLTDLFSAGLKALCESADGIMVKSVGSAARDAGEKLLAEWGERS